MHIFLHETCVYWLIFNFTTQAYHQSRCREVWVEFMKGLKVNGLVKHRQRFLLADLKKNFSNVEVVAALQVNAQSQKVVLTCA